MTDDFEKKIRELCGYVENGSDTSVKILQDDATKSWIVYVGKTWYWGNSMREAVDKAYLAEVKE